MQNNIKHYCRNPEVVFAQMGDELVMLSEEQGQYLGLNTIAADIWNLLEAPMAFAQLCSSLQQKYQVTAEQCETDVQLFLGQMLQHKLIVTQE
ncbi:PqqD family peptide modification chaperone [Rheinheimera sp. UJ63]|uniref:PqqD family peptide modification chaperone n=1 Tax=Rheinheimera sp. UJ63 TaxID=2910157 RepID=UPI001F3EC4FE|nr:PqqD family peptide modification chaperone [Rheinheimera sp. UJ63]MCF4009293.1 PqqD family peptide modification chaperone [Rheinheimera sp. UJ63]